MRLRAAAAALAGMLSACAGGNFGAYQADPLTVTPPSSPNWALAAPREAATEVAPTHPIGVFATGPEELLAALDQVALADARVVQIAPAFSDAANARAYVQRSAVFRFPDVISVVALDLGTGDAGRRAALVLYSRSVYGYSDLGVNGARMERWLAALGEAAPAGREVN